MHDTISQNTTSTRRAWIAAAVVVGALLVALVLLIVLAPRPPLVANGTPAPDFAAEELLPGTGQRTLSSYRGRVVLLNVWATWCHPCLTEMPSLTALQQSFDTTRFRVVAISVDVGSDDAVRQSARSLGLTFPVLHDRTGDVQQRYLFSGLPGTLLVDDRGVVRARFAGGRDWATDESKALVRRILDVSHLPDQ